MGISCLIGSRSLTKILCSSSRTLLLCRSTYRSRAKLQPLSVRTTLTAMAVRLSTESGKACMIKHSQLSFPTDEGSSLTSDTISTQNLKEKVPRAWLPQTTTSTHSLWASVTKQWWDLSSKKVLVRLLLSIRFSAFKLWSMAKISREAILLLQLKKSR